MMVLNILVFWDVMVCCWASSFLIFQKFVVALIFSDKQNKDNGVDYETMDCFSMKLRATTIFQNVRMHSTSNTAPHPKRLEFLAILL